MSYDTDASGALSEEEFGAYSAETGDSAALRRRGCRAPAATPPPREIAASEFQMYDTDGDGNLNADEYAAMQNSMSSQGGMSTEGGDNAAGDNARRRRGRGRQRSRGRRQLSPLTAIRSRASSRARDPHLPHVRDHPLAQDVEHMGDALLAEGPEAVLQRPPQHHEIGAERDAPAGCRWPSARRRPQISG